VQLVDAPGRFALAKPRLGRARGAVQVAGALVIEHPRVREAIVVPYDQIAGFAAGPDLEATGDDLVVERDLRVLGLTLRLGEPAGVVVVLRTPIHVGGFKFGTEQVFGVSRRERRTGIDVDVLELGVEDSEGLAAAMALEGLRPLPLVQLLREVGGEAHGPLREQRIEATVLAHRRAVRAMTGAAVLGTLAVAARGVSFVAEDIDWSVGLVVQMLVASLLCLGLATAWLLDPRPAPGGPPDLAPSRSHRPIVLTVVAVVAFVATLVAAEDLPRPILVSLIAVASGSVGGILLARVRQLSAAVPRPGVVVRSAPSRSRPWLVVPIVVVVLAAIVSFAIWAVPSDADRLAEKAVVTADQLPGTWTVRYDDKYGGDLDQHICGSDDGDLPAHQGGYGRGFERKRTDRVGMVWLDLTVLLARDEATAAREFEAVNSPGYVPCLLSRVEQMTEDYVADDAGPAHSYYGMRTVLDTEDHLTVVDRTRVEYLSEDGRLHLQHIVFVRMQVGRAIVRMPLSSFGGEIPEDDIEAIAAVVRDQVELGLAFDDE
jgi:hypothetical protein